MKSIRSIVAALLVVASGLAPPTWVVIPVIAIVAVNTPVPALAAVSSAVQWDVRTSGSDTNGGGFHVGSTGTDYSQQDSPQIAVTDAVTAGTTTITSVTANFNSTHVGNICRITGGTGSITASLYEVISVTNATTIVVDRSTGLTAGTGVTLNLGGSLASPGGMAVALASAGVAASGQIVNIKTGTYTLSSSANVAGGRVNTSQGQITWSGYQTSHGDLGTKPVLQAGASSMTIFTSGAQDVVVENLEFQPNGNTSVVGIALNAARCVARYCKATNLNAGGLTGSGSNCLFYQCEASGVSGGTGAIFSTGGGSKYVGCTVHGGSTVAFVFNAGDAAINCIAYANSNHGFLASGSGQANMIRCLAYGNTGANIHGFDLSTIGNVFCLGCLSILNGTSGTCYGFFTTASSQNPTLVDCAGYGNFTANTNGTFLVNTGFQSLTGDPTVAGGSGNFALNNTTGAGALCRGSGWPASWPGAASTTGYPDIGPVQHKDVPGVSTNVAYLVFRDGHVVKVPEPPRGGGGPLGSPFQPHVPHYPGYPGPLSPVFPSFPTFDPTNPHHHHHHHHGGLCPCPMPMVPCCPTPMLPPPLGGYTGVPGDLAGFMESERSN